MGLTQYSAGEETFRRALYQLWGTEGGGKRRFQEEVFVEAEHLLEKEDGLEKLFKLAHLFDEAGLFWESVWENISRLNPSLVRGTLQAGGRVAVAETLSELRILAVSLGLCKSTDMNADEAGEFLTAVIVKNMDVLLMKETEENRIHLIDRERKTGELLKFLAHHCSSPSIFRMYDQEIHNLAVQRPIHTEKIIDTLFQVRKLASQQPNEAYGKWKLYEKAIYYPSDLSLEENYHEAVCKAGTDALRKEAAQLSTTMLSTGLVSTFHGQFLDYIHVAAPELLGDFFTGGEVASKNLKEHNAWVRKMIGLILEAQSYSSIYGLARMLDRDIFTPGMLNLFRDLLEGEIPPNTIKRLENLLEREGEEVRQLLATALISVLGQPLGVGQGFNPTCQSTRALSYWAQEYPDILADCLSEALFEGRVSIVLEDGGLLTAVESELPELMDIQHLDAVSVCLLPYLQCLYSNMLARAGSMGEDPHKWINPAFHRKGVWKGFSDVFADPAFAERFRSHYHPDTGTHPYEELPQPAGVTIFDGNGLPLGAHAILIQRVEKVSGGQVRVYFYNPNNDSLQHWGPGIKTSVTGNGEREGESSLLFDDFLKCLYAFHYKTDWT